MRFRIICGAQTRRPTACMCKALANGRCPLHGGLSTGPRTAAGKALIAQSNRLRASPARIRVALMNRLVRTVCGPRAR
jgi:hypothetical protein